jgi:two-component system nitrogen regulation response regulator GlnG
MVTVMITGESGSGKELVARALHKHSPRTNGPFVAINTAAIPKDLLESELFGHERGAFTGAQTMRRGRFEQAEGGTLFLDEIGDMAFDLQTRLLRVLSDGSFYRVGGHTAVKTNVRVIAATHQNLEERVKTGSFREDLFHRLNVIRLRLPALRERREDVFMLTRHFLQQSAQQLGVEPKRISDAALQQLSTFGFPGNVRQLENICHWLSVMAPSQVVEPKDLPPEVLESVPEALRAVAARSTMPVPFAAADAGVPVTATLMDLSDPTPRPLASGDSTSDGTVHTTDILLSTSAAEFLAGEPAHTTPAVGGGSAHAPGAAPTTTSLTPAAAALTGWEDGLQAEALALLTAGCLDVWDVLSRRFEAKLIQTALVNTRGRRIEAAHKLGIGRNTITRKIQELNLE